MKPLWRMIRWVLAGVVALVLTAAAAAAIFTRTARFNDLLRVRLVSYLAKTYRGQITIGTIEGSIWGRLTLRDIEVRHRGSAIASIPQLRVGYQILPALHEQFVLSDVEVLQPTLHLAKDSNGQWNLLAAIAERNPSPPSPPTDMTIALHRLTVEQAAISVTTTPTTAYKLSDANFTGAGQIGPSGQSFKVETIAFALSGPGVIPLRAQGALDYNEARQLATIEVPNFSISTSRSQIDLSGTLHDLSAKIVDATVKVRKLAAADVNSFAPQADLARDLTGSVRINGNVADLHAFAALAIRDARLGANLRADLSKSQPVWSFQAQLTKFNLRKLFKRKDPQELPAGLINAILHGQGAGAVPASAKGTVDARITGLELRGTRLGEASMVAVVKGQTANIKALLDGPSGRAQLSGRVDMVKRPAYSLILALDHLRPASLIHTPGMPPADLSLTSTIDGFGYQPDTMRARVRTRLLPSTVNGVRIDGGRIDAQLASGILQIADAALNAGDTTAGAAGRVALNPNGTGRLTYRVTIGQASRWLAMAGQHGSGRIDLSGQVEGNLRNLRTSGAVELSALKLNHYSAAHARLTYNLAGLGSQLRPDGQIMLLMTGLHAGAELKSLQSTVRLVSRPTQTAALEVSAEDRFSHPASLRAEISYQPKLIVVNLSRMVIATSQGAWQLAGPAQLTKNGPVIEVHRFLAANQGQSVALDGTASLLGAQDLTGRIQGLRLADFSGFLPAQLNIAGVASSQLTVRGSAAAPIIALSATVTSLNVAGIPQAGLSARASYTGGRARADATLAQDATHSLAISAALPLHLSWARGFESRMTGDVDLRAASSGLDLAVLNAVRNPQVSGIGGALSLDVAAHGPLRHPVPHGFIRVNDGRALLRQTQVQVTAASAELELGSSEVRLASLTAKAGDGSMTGVGTLALGSDGTPRLNLRVAFDHWPAIATHQYNAAIAAHLEAAGTPPGLDLGGQIEVLHGVLRPDLSVAGGAPRPDQTVTVVQRWSETPHQPAPPAQLSAAGPLPNNLTLDLRIIVDRNTWIKSADFAVELEGDIHVHTKRRGSLLVFGTINTVRGTLVVASREFDLARGHIRFTGGHNINPDLDLVAQCRVQNYLLSATISGTANKPTLTLNSTPDLPQADILSIMMFGKPTSQLSSGQQKDLQNQAISMAGGYAASQVGQAVAQSLGLGELGLTTGSAGVGFGRYLSKNVYVSASQSTSNMRDRRAEIHYYLTPSVDLNTSASTNYGNEIKLQWHKEY